jgi:hypothetical protein
MRKKNDVKSMLRSAGRSPVDEQFLRSLREDLAKYLELNPPAPVLEGTYIPATAGSWFGRVAFGLSVGVFVAVLVSGAVAASVGSLPGNILYPVKLAAEDVRVAAAFGAKEKADLRIGFVWERLNEIQIVLQSARERDASSTPQAITRAIDDLAKNSNRVADYAAKLEAAGNADAATEVDQNLIDSVSSFRLQPQAENGPVRPDEARVSEVVENIKSNAQREIGGIQREKNPDAEQSLPAPARDENKEGGAEGEAKASMNELLPAASSSSIPRRRDGAQNQSRGLLDSRRDGGGAGPNAAAPSSPPQAMRGASISPDTGETAASSSDFFTKTPEKGEAIPADSKVGGSSPGSSKATEQDSAAGTGASPGAPASSTASSTSSTDSENKGSGSSGGDGNRNKEEGGPSDSGHDGIKPVPDPASSGKH